MVRGVFFLFYFFKFGERCELGRWGKGSFFVVFWGCHGMAKDFPRRTSSDAVAHWGDSM